MPNITSVPASGPGPFRICIVEGGDGPHTVTATDCALPTQHATTFSADPCFEWTPASPLEKGDIVLSSPGCTDLVITWT